jgi:signal-transduction protein with cAMP-binding, CBS, and nucleotidyltransferase domain
MNFLELPLFQSLSDQELEQMKTSGCLRTASYKKNDIIFSTGSTVSEIGIVLSGSVNVENIDFWGNKSILGNMNEGHIFAETYALCGEMVMVDVVTAEVSEVLFSLGFTAANSTSTSNPFLFFDYIELEKAVYKSSIGTGRESPMMENVLTGREVVYNLSGIRVPKLQKGINIVKYADGSIKKVFVR